MSDQPILNLDLSHRIHPGLTIDAKFALRAEGTVLFGASGAGKTTLLRLIAGLIRPDRGTIHLGGQCLYDSSRGVNTPLRDRHIGMIFQDDLLFPHLSAAENVRYGLLKMDRTTAEKRFNSITRACGIEKLLSRRPETLSGGERQRVGLARALAPLPKVLLCDEPVSALDFDARFDLISRLRSIQESEGIPTLFVTHSPAEAVAFGSRLLVVADGKIVDDGPPLELLAKPRTDHAPSLEGVRNVFISRVESHAQESGETVLKLQQGPVLRIPQLDSPIGDTVVVSIRAEDILLARGEVANLSARNRIAGKIERIVIHGGEAEVLVRTGALSWIVSVVTGAIDALSLVPGTEVVMILKARSCHILSTSRADD